jgi:NADH:ubiquinone oxidoreductase subunit E
LDVKVGKTTKDKLFTLEATRCLGCCGLAPVMVVDEDVYGRLEVTKIPNILKKYQ